MKQLGQASPCRTTSLIATHYSDPRHGSPVMLHLSGRCLPTMRVMTWEGTTWEAPGHGCTQGGRRPLGGRLTHSQAGAALRPGGAPRRPSSVQPADKTRDTGPVLSTASQPLCCLDSHGADQQGRRHQVHYKVSY